MRRGPGRRSYNGRRMANTELRRRLDALPGWLSYEEGELLYDLARGCSGRGAIVEIGSWRGKSTVCLGLGSQAGSKVKVYAVDRHTDGTFPDWQENVRAAGVEELVTPIKGLSQEVAADFDEPIELLFIDGAHTYDLVRQDFDRWVPKVVEGGVVAMHDTTAFPGVKQVAEESMYRARDFKGVRFVFSSTTVGTKVPETTALDRVRNRYSMFVMRALSRVQAVGGKKLLPGPLQRAGRRVLRGIQ
jgi:predicted O-methyltransferase YrrM